MGPLGHERYREYIADIGSSGRHLLELINDLLDLAKAEANKMTLAEERIDFAAVVASCLRLVGEQATRGGIALRSALGPDLPPLRADEAKIRQVLLNLLSNAIKFTDRKSTRLNSSH